MIWLSPLYLWILYVIGIQYKRGGGWLAVLPIAAVGYLLDILLNYTLFAALTADFPRKGEWTFSQRLSRLVDEDSWRGRLANFIAIRLLDPFDPDGVHIVRKK